MSTEKNKDTKKKACIEATNEHIYRANLLALGEGIVKACKDHPATPVEVDNDIRIKGLTNPQFLVIIGFATTKIVEQAMRAQKDIGHIVIIEPDLGRFHQTLQRYWVTDLAKASNVDILAGVKADDLLTHLYQIMTFHDKNGSRAAKCQQPEILVDPFAYPPKDGKNSEEAEKLTQIVMDASRQVFLSMGCASDSHWRFEQFIRNKKNIENAYRIEPLFKKFEGVPAFILGAGPSLKDFITYAKEYSLQDKGIIIAADAALKLLLDNDIKPHIVTRCERKLTNIFKGVRKKDTKGVYYAAYPWCAPEYFDLFEDSFMLFRDNGLCHWSAYNPGAVNGGVSSANAALELAYLFGCKEIVLSGVDLCFIDNRSHVEGTEVEFDPEKSKDKWAEIDGYNGKVTSIPVWIRCLNEYSNSIYKHTSKATVYNTSGKGAKINGTKLIEWEEVKERFNEPKEVGKVISKYLEKHPPAYHETFDKKCKETKDKLTQVVNDLEKLFLNIKDLMMTAKREEEKIVTQLQMHVDTKEYFDNVRALQKNMTRVYESPAYHLDQFKKKYYEQEWFVKLIIDMCQLDYFQTENRLAAIKNTVEIEHERIKKYIYLHIGFFKVLSYYCKELIHTLTHGPKDQVDYKALDGFEEL